MESKKMTEWQATMVLILLFAAMLGIFLAVSFVTHNFTYSLSSFITVCIALVALGTKATKPKKVPAYAKKAYRI